MRLIRNYHPFAIILFPIFSLLSGNLGQVSATDALRSVAIALSLEAILLLMLIRIVHDRDRAALLCSGITLLFFSYGHVYLLIRHWMIGSILVGRHRYLLLFWVLLGVVWTWFVLRRLDKPEGLSRQVGFVSIIMLILPFASFISFAIRSSSGGTLVQFEPEDLAQTHSPSVEDLPDIYYIILDGYGRNDVLLDLYGYDNSKFLDSLRRLGFYVADESRSNYIQTDLSLFSSLNMTYLDFLIESRGRDARDRTPLAKMIKENQVINFLREYDYRIIAFQTGYGPTVLNAADILWDSDTDTETELDQEKPERVLNSFENLLLRSSLAVLIMDSPVIGQNLGLMASENPVYSSHRYRIIYNLSKLKDVPELEGHKFVFAHILAPHPPFVFEADGHWIDPSGIYTLALEGTRFAGSQEEYIEGYRAQVNYINTLVLDAISAILAVSDPAPLIILQGDHGPGAFLDQDSLENSNTQERFSILNVYYFPDGPPEELYPSISPVNSFRLLFNQIFHTNILLLEDESFFSTLKQPFNFIPIPD